MSPTTWYVARSAGIVAYFLLTSSVLVGVLMAGRARLRWPRFAVEEIHRFLGILTAVFLVLHGAGLLLDKVVPFSLGQLAIPFTSSYRPLAVGLGVAAAELMAAVGVSNALRRRIPHRAWRRVHYLTIVVWLAATGHALLAGTDRQDTWFVGAVAAAVCAVAVSFALRFSRQAGAGAIAAVSGAALASVLALAFAPQPRPPSTHASTVLAVARGVPASFTGNLDARVVQGSSGSVVSVVGSAGTAGLRIDLLVDDGQVRESELLMRFPTGASCTGTVSQLGGAGLAGSCGRSAVRIAWEIRSDRHVVGRLAVSRTGA